MKYTSQFLLVILLSSTISQASYYRPRPHYPRSYSDDIETAGKVAVGVGCLAAIGYGVYKLCDWLFTPSDEKVLQRGIDALHNAHGFDPMIGFIESHYSVIPDNIRDQKLIIQSVNEVLLYDFAVSYKKDTGIHYLLGDLRNAITALQTAHTSLADRIKKLRKNNGLLSMVASMQDVDQEIIGLLCKLEFVQDYFNHHRSYYELFETETRILRGYDFELNALNQYQSNLVYHEYVKEAVRASVMRQPAARSGYPYMQYVDRIQAESNALSHTIGNVGYQYANRMQAAGSLLQNIKAIHAVVVAENAYHQELRDYKKEQLEKQRIEAEKAKAAAAAAQASAMQQQAWAMQHQNQLHAQQIRVDSERNAIMATQNYINAVNPPHVTVYV